MSVKILIVEDDRRSRGVAKRLLENLLEVSVVVETIDVEDAVRLARELRPDVVLMDSAMLSRNGLGAMRRLKTESPAMRVVILVASPGGRRGKSALMPRLRQGREGFGRHAENLPTLAVSFGSTGFRVGKDRDLHSEIRWRS